MREKSMPVPGLLKSSAESALIPVREEWRLCAERGRTAPARKPPSGARIVNGATLAAEREGGNTERPMGPPPETAGDDENGSAFDSRGAG